MEKVYDKLIRYAAIDTKANPYSNETPSTAGQWDLLYLLKEEMEALGLEDISLDENGYLFASLPSNIDKDVPVLGLLAHVDTSQDYPGKCTHPKIINYQGGDIKLSEDKTMTSQAFPILNELIGEDLLITDGTTLLGADDKAGIAEIMSAVEYLIANPDIKHGKIRLGFTPDEEIGRGPLKFDVKNFGADIAYTIDGSLLGEISYQSFNAANATIDIKGESIHPGSAKDKLINASLLAMELHQMLPVNQRPEYTEDEEGFYLLSRMKGSVENAHMEYIIRDHDRNKFEEKKELLKEAVAFLEKKYGSRFDLSINDSYYNMEDIIKDHMYLVDIAKEAMLELDIEPSTLAIRGGTDGSQLSFMGLPTPNLFAGYVNAHGPYEFAVLSWMEKSVEVIVKIVEKIATEELI